MLSRANRFHGHNTVRRVYRQGRSVRNNLGSLHVLGNRPKFKAAVVVSRKVNKSAVARNRIRRRIYEVIRLQTKNITEPMEVVVTVYQAEAESLKSNQLKAAVEDLFKKAKII
jgi:ribonuclease P protein component